MNRLLLQLAIVVLMNVTTALPQSSRLGESCDLDTLGAADTRGFLAFDRELHAAISAQDSVAMALLVRYPLRINDDLGSVYLNDAASLQSRFQEIFPPAVRTTILNQKTRTLFCNHGGITYGNGVVWVNATGKRYAIEAVNVPTVHRSAGPRTTASIAFICETAKERIVIDAGASGPPRYRAWTKPRSLTEKPDVEMPRGNQHFEGTGPCGYSTWTFNNGATKIIAEGLGCSGDSNAPPEGARGRVEASVNDNSHTNLWCF